MVKMWTKLCISPINVDILEVLVRLYTGKTHQIRVAFSHIGHPLVGDIIIRCTTYGTAIPIAGSKGRKITHMRTGEHITVIVSSYCLCRNRKSGRTCRWASGMPIM